MINKRNGFSLLELLVAIMLLGFILMVLMPRMGSAPNKSAGKLFAAQLGGVVYAALQRAVKNQRICKIMFSFAKKEITVLQATTAIDKKAPNNIQFAPATQMTTNTRLSIPSSIKIISFIIEGVDEMHGGSSQVNEAWIFCMPDGTIQPLSLTFIQQATGQRSSKATIHFNPFSGAYTYHEQ